MLRLVTVTRVQWWILYFINVTECFGILCCIPNLSLDFWYLARLENCFFKEFALTFQFTESCLDFWFYQTFFNLKFNQKKLHFETKSSTQEADKILSFPREWHEDIKTFYYSGKDKLRKRETNAQGQLLFGETKSCWRGCCGTWEGAELRISALHCWYWIALLLKPHLELKVIEMLISIVIRILCFKYTSIRVPFKSFKLIEIIF